MIESIAVSSQHSSAASDETNRTDGPQGSPSGQGQAAVSSGGRLGELAIWPSSPWPLPAKTARGRAALMGNSRQYIWQIHLFFCSDRDENLDPSIEVCSHAQSDETFDMKVEFSDSENHLLHSIVDRLTGVPMQPQFF